MDFSTHDEANSQACFLRDDLALCAFSCICSGTIGSDKLDNIDNMDEDFHPLTLKRSIMPPYVPTAR